MRARNIKPSLFKNEVLGVADPLLTIVFEGLWCEADREGRLEDRPLRLRAEILPYRDNVNMDQFLAWLADNGFIRRYEAKGTKVIQIMKFNEHQRPHVNESGSVLPEEDVIQHNQGSKPALPKAQALRSDSPSLIPDSPSLIPDTGLLDSVHTFTAIKAVYPAGLHRGDHWLLAERAVGQRLEEGIGPEVLLQAVRDYAAQQTALGTIGSEVVMRPDRFFNGTGAWKGPFPMPAAKARRSTSSADRITYVPTE